MVSGSQIAPDLPSPYVLCLNPNVAKVEDAVNPRRRGWASTELRRSQAVPIHRDAEPLTTYRLVGISSAFPKGKQHASFFAFPGSLW